MTATVVVEGVEIPEFLLAEEIQNHPGASAQEARAAAGKALAVKALLLHRADELGLTALPMLDDDGREETDEEALIRATLDAEVEIEPPGEAECRRVYETQLARFSTPALVEATLGSWPCPSPIRDDPEGWMLARQAAQDALDSLARRPERFADLARSLSACPSGQVGGSLGQLGPGDVVGEVEQALAGLAAGEILPRPVRSRYGWHVLRLDRRIEGRTLPFEYVADRIRRHLESRAWTAAAVRYVSDLADRARAQGVAFSLTQDGRLGDGSLSLGELLANGASASRLEGWLDTTDPALAGRVREAAAEAGLDVLGFVNRAVRRFVDTADDESWTHLISASQDAADPAIAAMASLLSAALKPKTQAHTYTIIKRR